MRRILRHPSLAVDIGFVALCLLAAWLLWRAGQ